MLSDMEFIRQSLELNLFFMRIAKEHSIFLEAGFVQKNAHLAQQADALKNEFTKLMAETIALSDGVISRETATSGELVTPLTLNSEKMTEFYSGIPIDTSITNAELSLTQGNVYSRPKSIPLLRDQVTSLNQRAIAATTILVQFKAKILDDMLSCRLFTFNYPLLIDHILREAHFYLNMLNRLQNRVTIDPVRDLLEQEIFWNRIMAEHAKFIRGLLDPTEVQLFDTADHFGKQFDALTAEAAALSGQIAPLPQLTNETARATTAIRDFKRSGTEGLLDCKIRSIATPLLGDHVVREANHYLRLLKAYHPT